jgi:hypothetical protein
MIVIIDLMGDEETVIVGGVDAPEDDLKKKERQLREIPILPEPALQIVPITQK